MLSGPSLLQIFYDPKKGVDGEWGGVLLLKESICSHRQQIISFQSNPYDNGR